MIEVVRLVHFEDSTGSQLLALKICKEGDDVYDCLLFHCEDQVKRITFFVFIIKPSYMKELYVSWAIIHLAGLSVQNTVPAYAHIALIAT